MTPLCPHGLASALTEAGQRYYQVLERELPRLHAFALLATGSWTDALAALQGTFHGAAAEVLSSSSPEMVLLRRLVEHLSETLGSRPTLSFQGLDDLLRAEVTIPVNTAAPPIDGDLRRLPVLVAEVQRACLRAALNCVPLADRLAFLVVDVLGYSETVALELLAITKPTLKVRLSRARGRLSAYLGPRCQHVARHNPCSCGGRLGVALAADFVMLPLDPEPPLEEGPTEDLGALFRRHLALRAPPLRSLVDPSDLP